MSARVLLIEDDASIREVTALGLTRAGLTVSTAGDGHEGLSRIRQEPFDLLLLDVMLPGIDGFELCREVRKTSRVPVVMLTARTDPVDVVVALESGADDYIRKPFEIHEVAARVRAVLRRSQAQPAETLLTIGDLVIDPAGFTVHKAGHELALSSTEFQLLLELARRPGQVFTRELLLARVWDYDFLGDSRLVDVAIQRLRAKIEDTPSRPTLIRTVRGVGYKLVAGTTGAAGT